MTVKIAASLRAYLLADPGVAALVGTRVFVAELPKAEAASMPRPACVLRMSGGAAFEPGSYMDHAYQRLDAYSYGATPYMADDVRSAVNDAFRLLRRGVTNNTLIHWVQPAGGWASTRDTDARWPMSFQSFQAFFALDEAA